MTRTPGASLQQAGRRFVYDNDPEEITRPDTVPAALRFAEESALSSGVGHARPRELAPYPRLPSLTDVTAANDKATVVDPPLAQPRKELRSGPRHRPVATVSTVPPPSRARQKIPLAANPDIRSEEPLRVAEQPPTITTSPPTAQVHAKRRWPFVLALLATAFAAAAFGTALGNGSVARTVERLHASPPPRETKPPPLVSAPVAAAREASRPTVPEASTPPVVRIEDLPLAEEGKGRRVPGPGRRIRAKAASRR